MKFKNLAVILCLLSALITHCYATSIDVEFITEPCLKPTPQNKFKLCDNMVVRVNNEYYVIPGGFETDLASIPRIMWPIFSPSDYDSIAAAVLHDFHYCCSPDISRKKADDVFYYALRLHGTTKLKAYLYYAAVRGIGWAYYQNGLGLAMYDRELTKEGVFEDVS